MTSAGAELAAAIREVISVEMRGDRPRASANLRAMEAWAAAHPEVPREDVCSGCFADVNREYYEVWGKPQGYPPEDCRVSRAWFWKVASDNGYTHGRYGQWDAGDDPHYGPESSTGQPDTSFKEPVRDLVPELSDALDAARGTLLVVRHYCLGRDARALLGDREVDTVVTELEELSTGVRELVGGKHAVPANLQPLFVLAMRVVHTAARLARRFTAAVADEEMDEGSPMTKKAIKNIVAGRNSSVALVMEPRSLVAAAWRGYHGAPCPHCRSRRCVAEGGVHAARRLTCLACGAAFEAPEWAACHSCGSPVEPEGVDCACCGVPTRMPAGMRGRPLIAP